ncbi:hypothetical protein ACYQR9_04655 [Methylobacterium sp. CM6241]
MKLYLIIVTICIAYLLSPAKAQQIDIEIFGHRLSYNPSYEDKDFNRVLNFGGNIIVKAANIHLKKIDRMNNVFYIVGSAGPGGNTCDAAPFIISIENGKPPKLFGPLDVCAETNITYRDDSIHIVEKGAVGRKVRTWIWLPETGLSRTEMTKSADTSKGWNTLWDRKITHPSDILESNELLKSIERNVGPNLKHYLEQISGIGSTVYEGDILTGTACIKSECDQTGSFISLDLQTKTIYTAFKPRYKNIIVQPPVREWPSAVRKSLAEWAKSYR